MYPIKSYTGSIEKPHIGLYTLEKSLGEEKLLITESTGSQGKKNNQRTKKAKIKNKQNKKTLNLGGRYGENGRSSQKEQSDLSLGLELQSRTLKNNSLPLCFVLRGGFFSGKFV